jgi:nicotinate phosphoribosyltransferase
MWVKRIGNARMSHQYTIEHFYSPLLTDFYQLTMAYGYYRLNKHQDRAAFHLFFRQNPFKSNYALACGLGSVVEFLNNWRFQEEDLNYLRSLKNSYQEPFFSEDFLVYLRDLKFTCDMDAIPEGTIVFPHEPLIRVEGPILQCQLLETPLLNIINFQTLIATKSARVCHAAGHENVIDFGMRRAQGPDGALSASRAAYIGGCVATSNTLAGKLYDIPVRGTHAHSWVTAFDNEKAAFAAYADIMPHNCVLLVDTYHTIDGVKNAIEVGKKLRQQGADLLGIRLDSGDMAALSIEARRLLDEAGFKNTSILASNCLDEYVIESLKKQGAKIDSWGVGTHLVTAYDHPALDGVYKLSALADEKNGWQYKLKLSEQAVKNSNPGRHQVRRFFYNEQYVADVIYDLSLNISDTPKAVLLNTQQQKEFDDVDGFVDLLQPIYRAGKHVQTPFSIHDIRKQAIEAVKLFYRTHGNDIYPVGLELNLFKLKQKLVGEVG